MHDKTMIFSLSDNRDDSIKTILTTVYKALEEKGYNPINQIVGYILSEDPTYITTHKNAISLSREIDRNDLLDALLKRYRKSEQCNIKRRQLMAEAKFFQYKGKPLVRCGDTIYYGDMNDSFVIKMVIKSKQPANDLEVADKVTVQLISTDPNISPRKAIVKTSEKSDLWTAIDIGSVWLKKALKEAAKPQ